MTQVADPDAVVGRFDGSVLALPTVEGSARFRPRRDGDRFIADLQLPALSADRLDSDRTIIEHRPDASKYWDASFTAQPGSAIDNEWCPGIPDQSDLWDHLALHLLRVHRRRHTNTLRGEAFDQAIEELMLDEKEHRERH